MKPRTLQNEASKQSSRRASSILVSDDKKRGTRLSRATSEKGMSKSASNQSVATSVTSDKSSSMKRDETRLRIARDRAAFAKQKASKDELSKVNDDQDQKEDKEEIKEGELTTKRQRDDENLSQRRTASHSPRRSQSVHQPRSETKRESREAEEAKTIINLIQRLLGIRPEDDLLDAIRRMVDVVRCLGGMQTVIHFFFFFFFFRQLFLRLLTIFSFLSSSLWMRFEK